MTVSRPVGTDPAQFVPLLQQMADQINVDITEVRAARLVTSGVDLNEIITPGPAISLGYEPHANTPESDTGIVETYPLPSGGAFQSWLGYNSGSAFSRFKDSAGTWSSWRRMNGADDALRIEWFGGKSNNNSIDNGAALSVALEAAKGRPVLLRAGETYRLLSQVTTPTHGMVNICSDGSAPAVLDQNGQAFDGLYFSGTDTGIRATLTQSQASGNRIWFCTGTTGVTVGMLAAVKSSKPWYFDPRTSTTDARKSELHRVSEVTSTQVVMEDSANDGYDLTSESVEIAFYQPCRVRVENVTVKARLGTNGTDAPRKTGVTVRYGDEPKLVNVNVDSYAQAGVTAMLCYRPLVEGGWTRNANNYLEGYGVVLNGCSFGVVDGHYNMGSRRAVDVTGWNIVSRQNQVRNCVAVGGGRNSLGTRFGWTEPNFGAADYQGGFGTHGAADHTSFINCTTERMHSPYRILGSNVTIEGGKHFGPTIGGVVDLVYGSNVSVQRMLVRANYGQFKDSGMYGSTYPVERLRPESLVRVRSSWDGATTGRIVVRDNDVQVQTRLVVLDVVPQGQVFIEGNAVAYGAQTASDPLALVGNTAAAAVAPATWRIARNLTTRESGTGTMTDAIGVDVSAVAGDGTTGPAGAAGGSDAATASWITSGTQTQTAGDARWARTDQQPLNASRFADLQSALSALSSPLYSVRELLVPPGTYTVASGLTLAADDATVTFQPGAVVNLDSTDFNVRALTVSGSRNRVVGGAVTSSARKKFLVSITGSDNVVERVRASHASKSTMAPVAGTSIYYNQGGFEVKGSRNLVRKAEAANTEGAGFYLYGDGNTIANCYSHDNCTGVIVETGSSNAAILDSVIVNNNVNNAEAYDGILATCNGLVVRGNTIAGNGEHGTYLHGQNIVVSGNVVRANYFNGIKLGNVDGFTVTGNVLDGNVTSLLTSESQIYIQKTFTNGTITGNVERANVAGTFIRVWSDTTGSYGVTITGNAGIGHIMVHAQRDLIVSGNITAGDILLGFNDASYPSLAGAVVSDNSANRIHLTRCTAPIVDSNVVKKITATADPLAATIKNNRMSAQDAGIPLRAVADFSGNTVVFTMTNATDTLFQQHTSKLTGGRFVNNVFTSSGGRFVYFTSEAISSDGMTFSGNTFAGVLQPLYFWGSGHMVIGNRADQQMGFLGCSNSIITNNIKEPAIRAGYTGNVIANNIT